MKKPKEKASSMGRTDCKRRSTRSVIERCNNRSNKMTKTDYFELIRGCKRRISQSYTTCMDRFQQRCIELCELCARTYCRHVRYPCAQAEKIGRVSALPGINLSGWQQVHSTRRRSLCASRYPAFYQTQQHSLRSIYSRNGRVRYQLPVARTLLTFEWKSAVKRPSFRFESVLATGGALLIFFSSMRVCLTMLRVCLTMLHERTEWKPRM